jgi:hypothetical protein
LGAVFLIHGNFEGVAVVRPDVDVGGRVGMRFKSNEQFEKSSVFRRYTVVLTASKVSWNIWTIKKRTRDHTMIRG